MADKTMKETSGGVSFRRYLVVAMIGMSCLAPLSVPGQETGLTPETVNGIERFVTDMMERDRVPGLAIAVVDRTKVLYARGFGHACPDHPVLPTTRFPLGSMSKSFTALAVMQLVEAGKLELDAPVTRYLEWFRVATHGDGDEITVRQLLHQTSGIPKWATGRIAATLEEHVRAIAKHELVALPGERHVYASPNYQVLGLLVEELSGEPFGDYVRDHIFAPLGMADSRIDAGEERDGLACGHRYWGGFPVAGRLALEPGRLPTASLVSTAEDMARYLIAMLNQGQGEPEPLLSPAGFKKLMAGGVDVGNYAYAMGWRRGPIKGVPAVHHGGVLNDYRGKMVLLPEQGQALIVLTNASAMFGPVTSHLVANGVVALLANKNPKSPGLALKWVLGGLGLVMLLFSVGLLREAVCLRRWRASLLARFLQGGPSRGQLFLGVAWGVLLPLGLFFGLPAFLRLSWSQLLAAAPDLTRWMLVYLPAALVLGLVKGWLFAKAWQTSRPRSQPREDLEGDCGPP